VSLYNEGAMGPIYPTPVIGMVGRLPDARCAGRLGFPVETASIALAGPFAPSLAAGELEKLHGLPLPDGLEPFDLDAVRTAQLAIRDAVRAGSLASAHDIAEGGLVIALAECCLAGGIGAEVDLGEELRGAITPSALLFGEGTGGFLVSGQDDALRELAGRLPLRVIGRVGGEVLKIADPAITIPLAELADAHSGLGELFS
jgi:phosphoribosylformylglycinamidine synthase subunit PurL